MARSLLVAASLAALTLVASPALADDDMPTGTQPIAYAARPLTLAPAAVAVLDKLSTTTAGMIYKTDPKFLNLTLGVGASMGVVENIEIGAVALPLQVLPSVSYGNPDIHGTFRFVKGGFELAAYVDTLIITHAGGNSNITLPVLDSSAGVVLNPGLLSRIHMGGRAKLDIGATVPIQLGSAIHDVGLNIPLELAFSLIEGFHIGATSGFGIANVKQPAINSYVPLGFIAGGTFGNNDRPVVDIGALFNWSQFANPGKDQKIDIQDFQAGLRVTAYVYFM